MCLILRSAVPSVRFAAAVLLALLFTGSPVSAQNCPAANPNDDVDDFAALQACLDQGGTIVLAPPCAGCNGYWTTQTLWLRLSGTVLTSIGGKARIIAWPSLNGPILQTENYVSDYELVEIEFNGNKFLRDLRNSCSGYRGYRSNLLLRGYRFRVHHVDSVRAMCGSALEIDGQDFEVYSNWVSYNGRDQFDGVPGEPWSDGITLLRCENGYVHDNTLENNTDVDLVVGGGANCRIQNNAVRHAPSGAGIAKYGFAGFHVGWFPNGGGTNSGSVFSGNTIYSDPDMLAFGIVVGYHPWDYLRDTTDGGSVNGNSSTGAVVNLAVDGVLAGSVQSNTWSAARGTRGYGCSLASDYTAADWGGTSLQNGWIFRQYHGGSCTP